MPLGPSKPQHGRGRKSPAAAPPSANGHGHNRLGGQQTADFTRLDYAVGAVHRARYCILATPGSGFKEDWVGHFTDRKVRALFDNDEGGRQQVERVEKLLGQTRVADEVLVLTWPKGTPDGYDLNDFVRDHPGQSVIEFINKNSYRVVPEPKLNWQHGWSDDEDEEVIDWLWPDHLRCGTYVSFSGRGGTFKSTIARELVARYTRGDRMPLCATDGLAPGHVIYVTAEDGEKKAKAQLKEAGAVKEYLHILSVKLKDGGMMNLLEHLEEIRQRVREYRVRLVVVDGQNSVLGASNISTDILARHNITNPLHQFAQQENVCLIGVRNEDDDGRAYGPASMKDIGRCSMRATEDEPVGNDRYFRLRFPKVSDVPKHKYPDIPYKVAAGPEGSPPRISWGEKRPKQSGVAAVVAHLAAERQAGGTDQ
jgi:hypothetical protein